MTVRKGTRVLIFAAFGGIIVAGATSASALTYVSTVVASGLNNPRSIAFGPDGALYIAEGGTFNTDGPSIPTPEGDATFGLSGSITRVLGTDQTRIVTGLPSLTNGGGAATGPQGIAFHEGVGYVVIGLGANPSVRTLELGSAPDAKNLASLYSFDISGGFTKIADIGAYEAAHNPAGGPVDSNPYHLTSGPNGLLVTDAGGNSLLNVTVGGTVSEVATFGAATNNAEPVPTGISVGPNGNFFVGQLTGYPFDVGVANIFEIDANNGDSSVFAGGFTHITDLAWGADGSLYVLQFADAGLFGTEPGSIIKVASDGSSRSTIFEGLIAPTGLEIGLDGALYVTSFSASVGTGQVLRIAAVPEPAAWAMMIAGFALAGGALRRRKPGMTIRYI